MSLSINSSQGFIELENEGIDFIKYVLEKTNSSFPFSKQSDLEIILEVLEKHLRTKDKFDADIQLILYKVQKIKKLLKKLHKALTDIERNACEEEKPKILKAMRADVSFNEISAMNFEKLPRGEFYNYAEIRKVLLRKLNGELDDAFFKSWIIFICNLLNCEKYDYISNYFDGYTFYDEYSAKEVLEMLATLKDFNYKLIHKDYLLAHKRDKLKVIYLRLIHFNSHSDSKIFKAYFVDYKTKRFDVRIIDDDLFDYRDDVMYCDIWSNHFGEDGDYLGLDDACEYEPAELTEEVQLMDLFSKEAWRYDHELDFN